ncbi:MAG: MM0924 family protein [Pyrinomonadaceae bacterium]
MEEFLSKMTGQGIDVYCGNARLRGEVLKAAGGILYLKDDEGQLCYVVIEKIVAVWEAKDSEHRAGFVAGKLK